MKKQLLKACFAFSLLSFYACGDLLETDSDTYITKSKLDALLETNETAKITVVQSLLSGMYAHLVDFDSYTGEYHDDYGLSSLLHMADLMGEDMVQTSSAYSWYYRDYQLDARMSDYVRPAMVWQYLYRGIKISNDILAQIPDDVQNSTLKHMRGQALAMRAMNYHYLVQFFQKTYVGHEDDPAVPLITEVPSAHNGRSSMRVVYQQMIDDLTESQLLLSDYVRTDKGAIDKQVAHGLLARIYLCMENWPLAAREAQAARSGYALMPRSAYLDGFKNISNVEWMFGTDINPESETVQTQICNFSSFVSSFSYGYASLTGMFKAIDKRLYDHINPSDVRKQAYQSPDLKTFPNGGFGGVPLPAYVNGKFGGSDDGGGNTQDLLYMRASEMYLIEAEALAAQGDTTAFDVFDSFIQTRDTAFARPAHVQALLQEIRQQRRIELWGEAGIAYFDIKRLKLGITRSYAGTNHPYDAQLDLPAESWRFTYQLPNSEIENNPDIDQDDNNPKE